MQTTSLTTCDLDAEFAEIIAREFPKLTGQQTPKSVAWTPGGALDLGHKVVKLAERLKWHLFPWQRWALEKLMSKTDGVWTHPECCLLVPRQNGKSAMLIFRVIYGIFVLGETIVYSAHQWETAKSLWYRMKMVIKDSPGLARRVASSTCSQGRGKFILHSGAQVVFTTRSQNAGRGLDAVDVIIYDESFDLTEADKAALGPIKSAAEDPQEIYLSSPVNQSTMPNGALLTSVRQRGLAGELELFYAEWRAPDQFDRTDPSVWRSANPSYGVIQTDRKMAAELRSAKTDLSRRFFDNEFLGVGDWPGEEEALDPVVASATFAELVDPAAVPIGASCLAIDCEPASDEQARLSRRWSVVAAVRTLAGAHIQVGFDGPSTPKAIAAFVRKSVDANDPVAVVVDGKSIARDLIERELTDAGIEPEFVGAAHVSACTNGFLSGIDDRTLTHDGDEGLAHALDVAGLRDVGRSGGVAWKRPEDEEICVLNAASYALWGLNEFDVAEDEELPPPAPSWDDTRTSSRTSPMTGDLLTIKW